MRTITTAAAFAIAASLAAGQPAPPQDSGKSGKSGTKSSKSGDCTDCSADVLTRANTVTSLTYDTYATDGVINQQSLFDFCCNDEGREAYLQAIEFTSGCLAYTDCLIAKPFEALVPDPSATITEGGFLTASVNTLCKAEQTGEKQPAVGGDECPTPEELCIILEIDVGPCEDERPGEDNNN